MSLYNQEPSREEQHVAEVERTLRILSLDFGCDYEDVISRVQRDFSQYQDEQSKQTLQSASEYAAVSGKGVAREIVALNQEVA